MLHHQKTRYLEAGTGHGLMALTLMKRNQHAQYIGLDLSEHSLSFAKNIFSTAGLSDQHIELHQCDLLNNHLNIGFCHAGICCEVLEHVLHPEKILKFLWDHLHKGAKVFITTVINIPAEDHIYLFRTAKAIQTLIAEQNFLLVSELVLPLESTKSSDFEQANYAAILEKV